MSDPTVIKMSLNLPALERLLGGNTEIEANLRQQIACQFAEKYLKPLLNSYEWQQKYDAIRKSLEELFQTELQKQIGTIKSDGWNKKLELNPQFSEHIRTKIEEFMSKEMRTLLDTYITGQANRWMRYADECIQKSIDKHIEQKIKEGIDERLRYAAKIITPEHK